MIKLKFNSSEILTKSNQSKVKGGTSTTAQTPNNLTVTPALTSGLASITNAANADGGDETDNRGKRPGSKS